MWIAPYFFLQLMWNSDASRIILIKHFHVTRSFVCGLNEMLVTNNPTRLLFYRCHNRMSHWHHPREDDNILRQQLSGFVYTKTFRSIKSQRNILGRQELFQMGGQSLASHRGMGPSACLLCHILGIGKMQETLKPHHLQYVS